MSAYNRTLLIPTAVGPMRCYAADYADAADGIDVLELHDLDANYPPPVNCPDKGDEFHEVNCGNCYTLEQMEEAAEGILGPRRK